MAETHAPIQIPIDVLLLVFLIRLVPSLAELLPAGYTHFRQTIEPASPCTWIHAMHESIDLQFPHDMTAAIQTHSCSFG